MFAFKVFIIDYKFYTYTQFTIYIYFFMIGIRNASALRGQLHSRLSSYHDTADFPTRVVRPASRTPSGSYCNSVSKSSAPRY